jgi:hypothetical protein
MQAVFDQQQLTLHEQLDSTLKNYFDPETGRFTERVDRLIKKDGDLEKVLKAQVGETDSELVRTLVAHVGDQSPLLTSLNPEATDGFLGALTTALETALQEQRDRVVREFSLDDKQSALSRLVAELSDRHGQIEASLEKRTDQVLSEFTLDDEDSALSRLVRRVERAQQQITKEFSLDEEGSALARMRKELMDRLDTQRQENETFQRAVLTQVSEISTRRAEVERSTQHGVDFEQEVFSVVQAYCQNAGDVVQHVGATTGLIKNRKFGDVLISLNAESSAPGAAIVLEAKQEKAYRLQEALKEIELARKNRGAEIGIFVYSARIAPEGIAPLTRYGNDLVIVWDAEDPRTDLVLTTSVACARALCTRQRRVSGSRAEACQAMDRAIRTIEKQVNAVDEIEKWTSTIQSNSGRILERTELVRDALRSSIATLDARVEYVRTDDE